MHAVEQYSALKRGEYPGTAGTWTGLEDAELSEGSPPPAGKGCGAALVGGPSTRRTHRDRRQMWAPGLGERSGVSVSWGQRFRFTRSGDRRWGRLHSSANVLRDDELCT